MNNRISILCIVLCGFFAFPLTAQVKYSNEFLNIGIGARAQGMAGVQVSIVDDVTAGYWNPAGLTQIEAPLQVAAMHAEWFAGVSQYDYLALAKPLNREKNSVLGFSLIRLGVDNIPNTLSLVNPDGTINYDNVSEFSAADYAFLTSYARTLKNPKISIGGNVKIIRRVLGSFGGAWGFGADLGIQYRSGNWLLGAQGRDLTSTFNAWSYDLSEADKKIFEQTGNEIPVSSTETTLPTLVLGAAYKAQVNEKVSLLSALDLQVTTDGQRNTLIASDAVSADPRLGFELNYDNFLQLRLGAGNFQTVQKDFNPDEERISWQPNFGIGMRLGRVQLDYALTDLGNVSDILYSHIFSVRVDFKEKNRGE